MIVDTNVFRHRKISEFLAEKKKINSKINKKRDDSDSDSTSLRNDFSGEINCTTLALLAQSESTRVRSQNYLVFKYFGY